MKIKENLIFDAMKKHSVRYKSTAENSVLRTVYIMKHAFPVGLPIPEQIEIEIMADVAKNKEPKIINKP